MIDKYGKAQAGKCMYPERGVNWNVFRSGYDKINWNKEKASCEKPCENCKCREA